MCEYSAATGFATDWLLVGGLRPCDAFIPALVPETFASVPSPQPHWPPEGHWTAKGVAAAI